MGKEKYIVADVSQANLKKYGGALSSRQKVNVRMEDGNLVEGFFTKNNNTDYSDKIKPTLEELERNLKSKGLNEDSLEYQFVEDIKNNFDSSKFYGLVNQALRGNFQPNISKTDLFAVGTNSTDRFLMQLGLVTNSPMEKYQHIFTNNDFYESIVDITTKIINSFLVNKTNENNCLSENININRRNNAMYEVAKKLGRDDLICESVNMTTVNGNEKTYGSFMLKAKGFTRDNICCAENEHGEELPIEISAQAKKDFASIQIIDYLCHNTDRHAGNMTYDIQYVPATESTEEHMEIKGVQGIDNDLSFGSVLATGKGVSGKYLAKLDSIECIDKEQADMVIQMKPEEFESIMRVAGLSKEEISAGLTRLSLLQEKIELHDIVVIDGMDNWEKFKIPRNERSEIWNRAKSICDKYDHSPSVPLEQFKPDRGSLLNDLSISEAKNESPKLMLESQIARFTELRDQLEKTNPSKGSKEFDVMYKGLNTLISDMHDYMVKDEFTDLDYNNISQEIQNTIDNANEYVRRKPKKPFSKNGQERLHLAKSLAAVAEDGKHLVNEENTLAFNRRMRGLANKIQEENSQEIRINSVNEIIEDAAEKPVSVNTSEIRGMVRSHSALNYRVEASGKEDPAKAQDLNKKIHQLSLVYEEKMRSKTIDQDSWNRDIRSRSEELMNSLEEYNLANGGKLYEKPEMQNLYGFIYDIRNASERIEEKAATEKLENVQAAYKDANLKTKAFNDSANAIADDCNKKQIPKEYIGADNTEIKNFLSGKASELNNVKAEMDASVAKNQALLDKKLAKANLVVAADEYAKARKSYPAELKNLNEQKKAQETEYRDIQRERETYEREVDGFTTEAADFKRYVQCGEYADKLDAYLAKDNKLEFRKAIEFIDVIEFGEPNTLADFERQKSRVDGVMSLDNDGIKAEINKKIDFLHNSQNQISDVNVAQRENGEEYKVIPEYFRNKEKLSELTEKLNACGRKIDETDGLISKCNENLNEKKQAYNKLNTPENLAKFGVQYQNLADKFASAKPADKEALDSMVEKAKTRLEKNGQDMSSGLMYNANIKADNSVKNAAEEMLNIVEPFISDLNGLGAMESDAAAKKDSMNASLDTMAKAKTQLDAVKKPGESISENLSDFKARFEAGNQMRKKSNPQYDAMKATLDGISSKQLSLNSDTLGRLSNEAKACISSKNINARDKAFAQQLLSYTDKSQDKLIANKLINREISAVNDKMAALPGKVTDVSKHLENMIAVNPEGAADRIKQGITAKVNSIGTVIAERTKSNENALQAYNAAKAAKLKAKEEKIRAEFGLSEKSSDELDEIKVDVQKKPGKKPVRSHDGRRPAQRNRGGLSK